MKTIGDPARFALAFELRNDPDDGGAPPERASWAALQIWVSGRNLTLGRVDDLVCDHAEVPLLPVVRWLVDNWDPLFHEERLPRPSSSLSAAMWRMDALSRLPEDDDELEALLEARERWWNRHGLGAALPEYRIPDVHIRRSGTDAEISWDDREWRTVPRGIRLVEEPGTALLPVEEVASVAYEWSSSVVQALRSRPGAEEIADELDRDLESIMSGAGASTRLEWAAGQELVRAAQQLRELLGVVSGTVEDTIRSLLGLDDDSKEGGLVTPLTVPVMLLRSAAPRLSTSDLEELVRLAKAAPAGGARFEELKHPASPPLAAMENTEDGYQRALDFRRALQLDPSAPLCGDNDLENAILIRRLGVEVVDVQLDDANADGVAILSPGRTPTIAVNLSGRFSRSPWGRRMTLAHELCHLLHDLDERGRVGVVSNPWAPDRIERRANAFAAMLLMPRAAVLALLPSDSRRWTREMLLDAMKTLGVGRSAFTWHLHNLGLISASEREAWVDEL